MRRRTIGLVALCTALVTAFAAQPAAAATLVGSSCTVSTGAPGYSVITLGNSGNPFPAAVPAGGVITKWSTSFPNVPANLFTQTLKIFRPTGAFEQFTVVGESATESVQSGVNTFSTRVPVQAGDRIGTSGTIEGSTYGILCATSVPSDQLGVIAGNPTVGAQVGLAETASGGQASALVSVEPDADGDGFGDETQDKCPQLATAQTECPAVAVKIAAVLKQKGSVVVLVSTTSAGKVAVSGTVNLGKGKKATLSSKAKTVAPGAVGRFKVGFTKTLKKRLNKLPRTSTLPLKIKVSATDSIGRVTTASARAVLKGQAVVKKARE